MGGSAERVPDEDIQEGTEEGTEEAHQEDAEEATGFREGLVARRATISSRIKRVRVDLARWETELKGIDAALEAMEDD